MTPTETHSKVQVRQSGGMLFLRARTPLHPGAGAAVGAVDLPVQREKHTGWPMIQGSAVKGVLRDYYRLHLMKDNINSRAEADKDKTLESLFGPAKADDHDDQHAGAVGFTDARILAFPLRSARGVFAWATCPAVIARLIEDVRMCGATLSLTAPRINDSDKVILGAEAESTLWVQANGRGTGIILEDMLFTQKIEGQTTIAQSLAAWLASNLDTLGALEPLKRLVILHDDAFSHAVKHCTEIITRIALNYDRKKVIDGALFSQELLPSETLMYSVCLMEKPRGGELKTSAEGLKALQDAFASCILQLGGDETTGKGWCEARLRSAGEISRTNGGA